MLSIFKNTLNNFIPKKLVSSNLYSLYLYRNLSNSFQKRLLTSSSSSNNDKNNDENKIEDKIEEKKEIDEIDKNEFNQENNDGSKYQPSIDDILGLFSSNQPTTTTTSSSIFKQEQESSSSKDKEEMDNFLFNFSSNEPKKSLSQTISSTTSSSSSTSSSNNEIAKLLSDFLVPTEENYILHIHASYNNTIVTLTNSHGNILITKSGGSVGFKKSQRGGYEAAHQAAIGVIQKIKEKNLNVKNVEICINGFGPGRDAAFKAIANVENQWNVRRITDTTPLPFNGCRPRKLRRL
ncbi:mitochondrial 37S ribosomal protein uS11m [Rhizophagus irregularis]|uniref:Translational machinery component n=2 Tax=Rhizophagus irregularis TaxID=588596 RepID=A0A015JWZ0_RHIIW|nr:hypothetical protein GLOIN_2v1526989 [Rhizophagus irregularis DAOM 181602=DAOM 197198]EXX71870.1 hypothetical protein RirG_074610 [Rhizophagus irregularis DAOM 197198w]POG79354.1 hypothetical protein GLOIN_2v1526989 [Rhizophagus irregularis DAOM 181602=DAOM 197198]UZO21665.1 hypothetical protein OCT59_014052 [Rhizophagus irregularis]GBC23007.1 translational machinery component [Rhizophagus irregularis DAOM 181602=DAOM 197198]|eukprot:XP_025186220.1 hypothetical protein GLOIN_2v1526989 [Rhizophagus irregularis DAOM 181602=DAOM 197198]